MDNEEFEQLVDDAIKTLPKEFLEKMENVSVVVADWPTNQQINSLRKRGAVGLLLGLYQGIPQTKRRSYGIGGPLPDKITIFKIPLLKISRSFEELKENVQNTVIHEIGHHFGMSEEDIQKAKSNS